MNDTIQKALDAIEAAGPSFGPWGAFVSGGLDAIEGAIRNAEAGVDPTPEEVARLVEKIQIPGEQLVPKRED